MTLALTVNAQRWVLPTLLAGGSSTNQPSAPMIVPYYLSMSNLAQGAFVIPTQLQTNVITTNQFNGWGMSVNASNQFMVYTNGPAFGTNISVAGNIYSGTEAHCLLMSNNAGFQTIATYIPGSATVQYLSWNGFVNIPAVSNTVGTFDLVVLGGTSTNTGNSEDWTLQLRASTPNNLLGWEDASTNGVIKPGGNTFLTNHWYYVNMTMDFVHEVNSSTIWDASTWVVTNSWSQPMVQQDGAVQFFEIGNNESSYNPGTFFQFSGMNWTNSPPLSAPPMVSPTNSLVAWYLFANNINDSSPNGNNLNQYGGYSFTTNSLGAANSSVVVANTTFTSTATNPVSAITVSFWQDNPSGAAGMEVSHSDFTGWYAYQAGTGVAQFVLDSSGGSVTCQTVDTGWENGWHMYTATWNGTGDGYIRIYKDGTLNQTAATANAGTIGAPATPMTIGSGQGYALSSGILTDVRIYGRALNATEIATIYANGPGGSIAP